MLSSVDARRQTARRARRENFPVASRLLPRRYRRHLLAVYRFARYVDDAGDEGAPGGRPYLLDAVDADLDRLYSGLGPCLPFVRELAGTVHACEIPAEPFRRLVAAGRRDQTVVRYSSFDDLLAYCELSANPVGHIVLHIFGAATPDRFTLSDHVCTALQIIEHCQDVGEDFARGRVYLPAEDLCRFGAIEDDLRQVPATPALRRVVALQVTRARGLLESGGPLAASLSGFARIAVAGYVAGGRAAATALERTGYDVLGRSARPSARRLLVEWPVAASGRKVMR
jgi:squalene synthase HpnC